MCTSANYRLTSCHPFALEQKLYIRTLHVRYQNFATIYVRVKIIYVYISALNQLDWNSIYVRVKIIYVYIRHHAQRGPRPIYVRVKIIYVYIKYIVILAFVDIYVRVKIMYVYTTFCLSSCISAASSKSYHQ